MILTRHRRTLDPPVGRWPAPALVERTTRGVPLPLPYPQRRATVRRLLRVAGAAVTVALAFVLYVPLAVGAAGLMLVGVAPAWLAARLAPLPDPLFVTLGYSHPHELTHHEWIRLPDGWAVQTYDVRVVAPDTLGDPIPARVQARCSDNITRVFRPHDVVHVVAPVDLR